LQLLFFFRLPQNGSIPWKIGGPTVKISRGTKKKNIYFANSKNNYNTNIICKHRGGFPEGQSPIVLDTLSNAEYSIKYLKNKNKKNSLQYITGAR